MQLETTELVESNVSNFLPKHFPEHSFVFFMGALGSHGAPPHLGAMHFLILIDVPFPQFTEHRDHPDHCVNLPSTVLKQRDINLKAICFGISASELFYLYLVIFPS